MGNEYNIVLSRDSLDDISSIKKYILNNFGYREYAEKFSKKIFVINEMTITVIRILKDRMYWQGIIEQM